MITREDMEEMRQDCMQSAWEDEQYEIKMRKDDDFFYDAITHHFEASMRELEIEIDNFCMQYNRDEATDEWFRILMEK